MITKRLFVHTDLDSGAKEYEIIFENGRTILYNVTLCYTVKSWAGVKPDLAIKLLAKKELLTN